MPDFLSVEDVLFLHSNQVDLFGGIHGIHDLTISVATGQTNKQQIADFFRNFAR
jgi:hypothetical protein